MKFNPKSEDQVSRPAFQLLPRGEYFFSVRSAEDKRSPNNNDYISLVLEIWEGERIIKCVFDHLVNTDKMDYKIRHFCDSTNILNVYESGNLCAADTVGKTGMALIDVEKDKKGTYPDKNIVRDYIKRKDIKISEPQTFSEGVPVPNDDLPF